MMGAAVRGIGWGIVQYSSQRPHPRTARKVQAKFDDLPNNVGKDGWSVRDQLLHIKAPPLAVLIPYHSGLLA